MKLERGTVYDRAYVEAKKAAHESTDQFKHLPAEIQDAYRARWQEEVDRQVAREMLKHDMRIHTVLSCVGLFVFVTIVWDGPTIPTLLGSVLIGAVTGWSWHVLDAGRFLCLATVLPGYLVLRVMGPGQSPYTMFFGAVAMVSLAALVGSLREFRTGNVPPALLKGIRERRLKRERDNAPPESDAEPRSASRLLY